jgi:L-lactate permease
MNEIGPWAAPIISALVVLAITVVLWKKEKKRELEEKAAESAELLKKQYDAAYQSAGENIVITAWTRLGPFGLSDTSRKQQGDMPKRVTH